MQQERFLLCVENTPNGFIISTRIGVHFESIMLQFKLMCLTLLWAFSSKGDYIVLVFHAQSCAE